MPSRTTTRAFKMEVVRQLASGAKRPAQVCREQQLAESVLSRWRRDYAERGEAAFTPRSGAGADASTATLASLHFLAFACLLLHRFTQFTLSP